MQEKAMATFLTMITLVGFHSIEALEFTKLSSQAIFG